MAKKTHEEELERKGKAILDLMGWHYIYDLKLLKKTVKARVKGVFAVVDAEFDDVITYLLNKGKLVDRETTNKYYTKSDPEVILHVAKVVAVAKANPES